MYPTFDSPASGRFVYDQVQQLSKLDGVDLGLYAFNAQSAKGYLQAAQHIRKRYRNTRFDIVHSHFGLTAWLGNLVSAKHRVVTFHGTDLAHPRSRAISLAAASYQDVLAVASPALLELIPNFLRRNKQTTVLPTGVDTDRFKPIDRKIACKELALDPKLKYVLFPADPKRAEKRFDRLQSLKLEAKVLTLGDVHPNRVPLYINASHAVVIPSEREGFGLAAVEALACNIPAISTPVGAAETVLKGLPEYACLDFNPDRWKQWLERVLSTDQLRTSGSLRAELFSAKVTAERTLDTWRELTD